MGSFARAMIYGNPPIDMIRTRGGVDPDRMVDALEAFIHWPHERRSKRRIPIYRVDNS
jgi:hypothetical protein